MLYSEGLPFKVKEYLIRERDYHTFTLQKAMAEANRHNNVSAYLSKGKPGGGWKDNKLGDDKQDRQGDKQDSKEFKGANNRYKFRTNYVASLWDSCNMILSEKEPISDEINFSEHQCEEMATYL